jgi:cell division GTPase FtsZ
MVMNAALSHLPDLAGQFARVSIVGLGADGNRIVSNIFEGGSHGAQCIALSTDREGLAGVYAHERILIEPKPAVAKKAHEDSLYHSHVLQSCMSSVTPLLVGTDVAFIVAKMGWQGRAGLTSAVSEIARQAGAVVVGVAVLPLPFEKDRRLDASHELAGIRNSCHTLAIVDAGRSPEFLACPSNEFGEYSDHMVTDFVSGLAETLACPAFMNISVAAFRELMTHGGIAHLGMAQSSSTFRAEEAAIGALRGPLLYDDIGRTRGALVCVRGDSSLTAEEAEMAADLVSERAGRSIPVVTGAHVDESWDDGLQVAIMMTGGAYPYIPGGYRRLPLAMYEMEPDTEEEPVGIDLDLDQLEES